MRTTAGCTLRRIAWMSPFRTMTDAGRTVEEGDEVESWSRPNARNDPAVTRAATSAPTRPPTSAERPLPGCAARLAGGGAQSDAGVGGVHGCAGGGSQLDVPGGVHPSGVVCASAGGAQGFGGVTG